MEKQYLLVINYVSRSVLDAVKTLRAEPQWASLEVAVVTNQPEKPGKYINEAHGIPVRVLTCTYENQTEIAQALEPIANQIVGVACRGDKKIQYLRKIIPLLPKGVHVASSEALATATNKQLMRAAFEKHCPAITLPHIEVHDGTPTTIAAVEKALPYPVIVKPTNLASSLLIQSCNSRTELEDVLHKIFDYIATVYKREGRHEQPQVIVESYVEGDFYSIDAYSLQAGEIYCCPPVAYIPAKQIGIDDFFIYKRFIPTKLTKAQIAEANDVVKQALVAVGLTYSSAHVEMVLTTKGWKVIELGPRLGRFRHRMYQLSYGIEHALNDIKIHLGMPPIIPDVLQMNSMGYSIYPFREGRLKAIEGLNQLYNNPRVTDLKVSARPGDICKFAKHGGHSLAEFIVFGKDAASYDSLTQEIDKTVFADIE